MRDGFIDVNRALQEAEALNDHQEFPPLGPDERLDVLEEISEDDDLNEVDSAQKVIKTKVALDSGATTHTTHPADIPDGAEFQENETGKNFSGAGGHFIKRHGTAQTVMTGKRGSAAIPWEVADVTRALQSVSKTCGPQGQKGHYDVLFTNECGYVVTAGTVEQILAAGNTKVAAEYPREGNLYVAEVELVGFPRRGGK